MVVWPAVLLTKGTKRVNRNTKYLSTLETESLEALGRIFPAGFLFMNEYRGRRSVEGVLMAAAEGGNRKFKDFYKLARELRRYVVQAGHGFSYNDSLNSIAIVMGYPSFRAARRNSARGIIPIHRLPEGIRHLKMPNLEELIAQDAARTGKALEGLTQTLEDCKEQDKPGASPRTYTHTTAHVGRTLDMNNLHRPNWFVRQWYRVVKLFS